LQALDFNEDQDTNYKKQLDFVESNIFNLNLKKKSKKDLSDQGISI